MDIQELLDRVEYMKGWRFEAGDTAEGPVISISFSVPDSVAGDNVIQLQKVWTFVPPMTDDFDFYAWLYWRLQRIALHEVGEFYRIDGELWDDPHQPIEDRLI